MATNWTLAEATKEILSGNKEAICDIGKRFPLTATAIASMGNNEGALTIINALPGKITARKIEQALKGDVEDVDAEDVDNTPVENEDNTPVEKSAKKRRNKKAKVEEPVEDANDEEEDDPVALYKECKKAGLKVKARQSADYYKAELAKLNEENDDDWDDDEEVEETPKKPAKKDKKPAKKAAPKKEEPVEDDDDDDDDDDWDI